MKTTRARVVARVLWVHFLRFPLILRKDSTVCRDNARTHARVVASCAYTPLALQKHITKIFLSSKTSIVHFLYLNHICRSQGLLRAPNFFFYSISSSILCIVGSSFFRSIIGLLCEEFLYQNRRQIM